MANPKEKVLILIDGSNLYHRLREIFNRSSMSLKFNYDGLIKNLIGNRKLVAKRYYIGAIRAKPNDKKGQKLRKNQQRLFAILKKSKWEIYRGFILKTNGYHEKGVDVKIAVDLVVGAYENFYDTAILVSSDTDLLPAIDVVLRRKKKVEYIGFGHKPSFALQKHCSESRLLTKVDLEKFIT